MTLKPTILITMVIRLLLISRVLVVMLTLIMKKPLIWAV